MGRPSCGVSQGQRMVVAAEEAAGGRLQATSLPPRLPPPASRGEAGASGVAATCLTSRLRRRMARCALSRGFLTAPAGCRNWPFPKLALFLGGGTSLVHEAPKQRAHSRVAAAVWNALLSQSASAGLPEGFFPLSPPSSVSYPIDGLCADWARGIRPYSLCSLVLACKPSLPLFHPPLTRL